jgi:hypothetical protein
MKSLTFCAAALTLSLLTASASAFTWGVGGHKIYAPDSERDFSILEARGLTTYRFDILLTDDRPDMADQVRKLIPVAKVHHVTLHPAFNLDFADADAI